MSDVEQRLRERLVTLTQDVTPRDLTGQVVDAGRRARRRRTLIASGTAAVAVAGVLTSTVVLHSTATDRLAAPHPTPPVRTDPATGIPGSAFHVAPPMLEDGHGPAPAWQRACGPSDITATAEMRSTSNGLAGVVELAGDHCSLRIYPGPTALLDEQGNPLAVPVRSDQPAVNPASTLRPDLSLAAGHVVWGFSWRGSWCGPRATAVRFPLHGATDSVPIRLLDVPLTGPALACHGSSDAVLVPGVPASPAGPALTAPPAWSGLRATLAVPESSNPHRLTGMVATLRNETDAPISLSPCPDYALMISGVVGDGTAVELNVGTLSCTEPQPTVIPAHGDVRIPLADRDFSGAGAPGAVQPGTVITLRFAIAGVPTATATTRAQ